MKYWRVVLLSFFLVTLIIHRAVAQEPLPEVLTYDTYADFVAVFPSDSVLTFEDTGAGDASYGVTGFHADGISIFATDGYLFGRANDDKNGFLYGSRAGGPSSTGAYIQIDLLDPNTNAFGAHVGAFYVRTAGEVKVTLSTGHEFSVPITGLFPFPGIDPRDSGAAAFFGVVSAEPLQWVRFEIIETDNSAPWDIAVLDNISFGYSDLFDGSGGTEPEPFCGDTVLDSGEECDDGNNMDGDGCSSDCMIEMLHGNGVLDPDEECDDGNVEDGDGCAGDCVVESGFSCHGAPSLCEANAPQNTDQRECIYAMNKYGAKLARAWNKSAYHCLKHAGKEKFHELGPGGDAESCLSADVEHRVAERQRSLLDEESDSCLRGVYQLPDFAYLGAHAVTVASDDETLGMLEDVFGDSSQLNDVVVLKHADKYGRKCQHKTYKRVRKLFDAKMKTFYKCKKHALKGEDRVTQPMDFGNTDAEGRAASRVELQTEIMACLNVDSHHRIEHARAKLEDKVDDKCTSSQMTTPMVDMFPGVCATAAASDPSSFVSCLDRVTECRACRSMNAFDGFSIDCDERDNGVADGSCS